MRGSAFGKGGGGHRGLCACGMHLSGRGVRHVGCGGSAVHNCVLPLGWVQGEDGDLHA
jgi:hypothetical protein